MQKVIWICGIPSSGKTTLGLRLLDELSYAGKATIMLDDGQLKYLRMGKETEEIIRLLLGEYNIIVTPNLYLMHKKPDLLVWCRCPISECVKRDKIKYIGGHPNWKMWQPYIVDADLILDTYDPREKTEDNIEICWQKLKYKMEELFGYYKWRIYGNKKPNWYRPKSGFQNPR